jgi:hypothetical protein
MAVNKRKITAQYGTLYLINFTKVCAENQPVTFKEVYVAGC